MIELAVLSLAGYMKGETAFDRDLEDIQFTTLGEMDDKLHERLFAPLPTKPPMNESAAQEYRILESFWSYDLGLLELSGVLHDTSGDEVIEMLGDEFLDLVKGWVAKSSPPEDSVWRLVVAVNVRHYQDYWGEHDMDIDLLGLVDTIMADGKTHPIASGQLPYSTKNNYVTLEDPPEPLPQPLPDPTEPNHG